MKKTIGIILGLMIVLGSGFVVMKNQFQKVEANDNTNSYQVKNVQNLSQELVVARKDSDKQVIETQLGYYGYPVLVVEKDTPVEWDLYVDETNLTSCNDVFEIPTFQKEIELQVGENKIEFIPTSTGILDYQCWMGMIRSNIVVVDSLDEINLENIQQQLSNQVRTNTRRCCSE